MSTQLDVAAGVVFVDRQVSVGGSSTWVLDGVVISFVDGLSIGLPCDTSRLVGSSLVQHQTLSSVSDVQRALLDFWTPKWQAIENIPSELWHRLSNFVGAYMPKLTFCLPPSTTEQWKRRLKGFKPHAARGTDGFSHMDLINMPETLMASLLDLFNEIEEDRFGWPLQFLHGMIKLPSENLQPVLLLSSQSPTGHAVRSVPDRC